MTELVSNINRTDYLRMTGIKPGINYYSTWRRTLIVLVFLSLTGQFVTFSFEEKKTARFIVWFYQPWIITALSKDSVFGSVPNLHSMLIRKRITKMLML